MVVQAYNSSTQEDEARDCQFKSSLGYTVSLRMTWTTFQDPVQKRTKEQIKPKKQYTKPTTTHWPGLVLEVKSVH
jgi:hypothetical protein